MGTFEDALARQAQADPVTQALLAPLRHAVRAELDEHMPGRLTRTQKETAAMLGIGEASVRKLVDEGRLVQIDTDSPRSPLTLASILQFAGWPLRPAPLASPLQVIPGGDPKAAAS